MAWVDRREILCADQCILCGLAKRKGREGLGSWERGRETEGSSETNKQAHDIRANVTGSSMIDRQAKRRKL